MNKKYFLEKIKKNLKSLPAEEINDILGDFEEYFEIGKERGRTEEEIALSLGDPRVLAKQIRAETYVKKAEEITSALNITKAVFTSIGIGFLNIIFTLPLFIIVLCILGIFYILSVSMSATGLTGILASLFYPLFSQYLSFMVNPVAAGFAFLGLCCLGILFFIGNLSLSKIFYRLIIKYLKFNLKIVKDRRKKDEV